MEQVIILPVWNVYTYIANVQMTDCTSGHISPLTHPTRFVDSVFKSIIVIDLMTQYIPGPIP